MRKFKAALLALVLFLGSFSLLLKQERISPSTFVLDLKATKEATFVLFYQFSDYSEKKSKAQILVPSKDFQKLTFDVPAEKLNNIRVTINSKEQNLLEIRSAALLKKNSTGMTWPASSLQQEFYFKYKKDLKLSRKNTLQIWIKDDYATIETGDWFAKTYLQVNKKGLNLFLAVFCLMACVFLYLLQTRQDLRNYLWKVLKIDWLKKIFGKENVYIIIFFVLASILQVAAYMSAPNLAWNLEGLGRYVIGIDLMNFFFIENIVMALVMIWLLYNRLWSRVLVLVLFIVFSLFNSFQFLSVYVSSEFINEDALMNTGNIGMLINSFTLSVLLIPSLFSLAMFIFLFIYHRHFSAKIRQRIIASLLLMGVAGAVYFTHLIPKIFFNKKNPLELTTAIANQAPLMALGKTLWDAFIEGGVRKPLVTNGENTDKNESKVFQRFVKLTARDLKLAKEYGLEIQPHKPQPFLKDLIYKGSFPFVKKPNKQKPNVIILFVESLSARKLNVYGVPYRELTPNISDFAKHGMVVDNYFSHLQTTNRALQGQLCSMYASYGYQHWLEKKRDMAALYCLPHVMNEEGYQTIYMSHDSPTNTHLDYQMESYGFTERYFKHDFAKTFLNSENPVLKKTYDFWPAWGLSDHQMFRGLIEFLRTRKDNKKPFFAAMSTIETHFMLNISADGVKYKNGRQPVLNTTHNLDHAFGLFWEYFKNSSYFENTILILTADHSHFPDADYTPIAGPEYKKKYCDKIALIIYNPFYEMPARYEANSTSLDFAPSLLNMLGVKNRLNVFLGWSIFSDRGQFGKSLAYASKTVYDVRRKAVREIKTDEEQHGEEEALIKIIRYAMEIEKTDRLWVRKSK